MTIRLYKHCREKYLPSQNSKLRVGTLYDFRNIENNAIRDKMEGRFSFQLIFNGKSSFSYEYLNGISFGKFPKMGPGERRHGNVYRGRYKGERMPLNYVITEDLVMSVRDNGSANLMGSRNYELSTYDCFAFCLSAGRFSGSVIHDSSYNSIWSIIYENRNTFKEIMRDKILSYIKIDEKLINHFDIHVGELIQEGSISHADKDRVSLDIKIFSGWISYKKRNFLVESPNDFPQEEFDLRTCRSDFMKPNRFSREKEYRMLFYPIARMSPGSYSFIKMNLSPINLPSAPFLDEIKVHF